jgi:hypothetical protein
MSLSCNHISGFGVGRFDPRMIPNLAIYGNTRLYAAGNGQLTFPGSEGDGQLISGMKNNGLLSVGDYSQGTGANQPLYRASAINGFPALEGRHDGATASQLQIADHAGLDGTKFTHFMVAQRVTDTGAIEQLGGKYTSTGNQREHRITITASDTLANGVTDDGTNAGGHLVTAAVSSPTIAVGAPFIAEAVYDGTTVTIRRNGVATGTGALSGNMFNGTAVYSMFSFVTLADPFAGYIGFDAYYTADIGASARSRMLRWLSQEWKIVLA